jgi:DNA-binding MarR family transcriptional regulator
MSIDEEAGSIYATFWRMIYMSVHRYHSSSTRELLTVMTITLLVKTGHNPTISELTEITGLPKSSLSRYVSRQIKSGFLTEVLDPQDRRRHCLYPTKKGQKEEDWHEKDTLAMVRLTKKVLQSLGTSQDLSILFNRLNIQAAILV